MCERINREIKRRTRVAGLFPNESSDLRLLNAILMETSDEWKTGRAYFSDPSQSSTTNKPPPPNSAFDTFTEEKLRGLAESRSITGIMGKQQKAFHTGWHRLAANIFLKL